MSYNANRFRQRVDAAKAAIDDVFGDTGVRQAQTREALEELVDHIRSMLDTLTDT